MPTGVPTPEERARLEKSRTISDVDLLKGGANYIFDENGGKVLSPSEEQIEEIHKKMEGDLKTGEVGDNNFYKKSIKNDELFFESESNKEKFDKLFLDMDNSLLQVDDLISEIKVETTKKQFKRKIEILREAISGDLKSRIDSDNYCCLGDSYFGIVKGAYGDSTKKYQNAFNKSNKVIFNVLNYNREAAGENLSLALDRLILEILTIAARESKKSAGNDHDSDKVEPIIDYYSETLGISQKEAAQGITNRMKTQRIKITNDEMKIEK